MRLLGRTDINTNEEPNNLRFVLAREYGRIELAATPLALMVLTTWAVFSQLYFLAALSVLGNLALLLTTRKRTVTTLSASKSELIVQIGVDGANTREKKVDTLNIESLGYQISTKYGPSGLFVDEGFLKPTCLLLGLTRQQVDTIADTICTKFSNIKR